MACGWLHVYSWGPAVQNISLNGLSFGRFFADIDIDTDFLIDNDVDVDTSSEIECEIDVDVEIKNDIRLMLKIDF